MPKNKLQLLCNIFWFRRDLRWEDNRGLFEALKKGSVLPLFIFDPKIILDFHPDSIINNNSIEIKKFINLKEPFFDRRISLIYFRLLELKKFFQSKNSDLLIEIGEPLQIFEKLISKHKIQGLFFNHDYEPKMRDRDERVRVLFQKAQLPVFSFKDHLLFEKSEILNQEMAPYKVFTSYKKKWLSHLEAQFNFKIPIYESEKNLEQLLNFSSSELYTKQESLGVICDEQIKNFKLKVNNEIKTILNRTLDLSLIKNYHLTRNQLALNQGAIDKSLIKDSPSKEEPFENGTSLLGPHLRFGLLSPRKLIRLALDCNEVWLSELIWREFFSQSLYHFPETEHLSFDSRFERLPWRKKLNFFQAWCEGRTGFPLVDAGIRELICTGYMHNRTRMLTANFLTKILFYHWSLGEKFFAKHLLDYDKASNVGNWQWSAGSGCDAAPYFRIFNPELQQQKFDPHFYYIKKWIPEWETSRYPKPIIDFKEERQKNLYAFSKELKAKGKI